MAQSTPELNTKELTVVTLASETSIVGTDASAANNVLLRRGSAGELEVASGDDTTPEGTRSPNKAQINVKNALIGTSTTLTNNVKLHRGGNGELGFVLGDSVETEGDRSNNSATIHAKNIILGDSVNQDNNIQIRRAGTGIVQFTLASSSYADGTLSPNYADVLGSVPVGSIVAWNPGFFLDGINGTFVEVLSNNNTIADANIYLNPRGYYVADGSVPNVTGSLIWNAVGRYLPNLTDDRFLMGGTVAGVAGGSNTQDHSHSLPSHYHGLGTLGANTVADGAQSFTNIASVGTTMEDSYFAAGGVGTSYRHSFTTLNISDHTHTINLTGLIGDTTGANGDVDMTSGPANNTENRPKYLSTFFIVRVF